RLVLSAAKNLPSTGATPTRDNWNPIRFRAVALIPTHATLIVPDLEATAPHVNVRATPVSCAVMAPTPPWHPRSLEARLPFLRRRATLTAATRAFFTARGYSEVE